MANRWDNSRNSDRLCFLGSKITADGDCSHEIKRHLFLGRKVMTNLDSILKSRVRQPTPVLLPGTFHGLRSLVGYSPWGHKESDMTEQLASLRVYKVFTKNWSGTLAKRRLCLGPAGVINCTPLKKKKKGRVITLPTMVHLVKAMVFPVVMYRCESWTIKKNEHQINDAF